MTHVIVCTHSRHDLARGAVLSVRKNAIDALRITVLDSSGTLLECEGADVQHIRCARYGAQMVAHNQFRKKEEVTVCIDDDVRLVSQVDLGARYAEGWFKCLNGQMVVIWGLGNNYTRLTQWRTNDRCVNLEPRLCALAAATKAEQLDEIWLHIDKGSWAPTPERDALIHYLDHERGPGGLAQ